MIADNIISWKLRLQSSPEKVYRMLTTDNGRASFWAESAKEMNGTILFQFPDGQRYDSKILHMNSGESFILEYFKSTVEFKLSEANNCTILTLTNSGVDPSELIEVNAGWVSVLMSLKCACDYNIDIRNHDRAFAWDKGFVEN